MKRIYLFVAEHVIELGLTWIYLTLYFVVIGLTPIQSAFEVLLATTVSFFVRAGTQIPFCAYVRIRAAKRNGFSMYQSVGVVTIWFPVVFFIVFALPVFLAEYDFMMGRSLLENAKELDGEIFAIFLCYMAALTAPIVLHGFVRSLYDSPIKS